LLELGLRAMEAEGEVAQSDKFLADHSRMQVPVLAAEDGAMRACGMTTNGCFPSELIGARYGSHPSANSSINANSRGS